MWRGTCFKIIEYNYSLRVISENQQLKEKAEELIKDLSQIAPLFYEESIDIAKYMVEEIINSSPSLPVLSDNGSFSSDIVESKKYWQEVKTELKKL